MVSVVRFRLINLAGSLVFLLYGVLISSLPVVLTNGFITLINVYHLYRIFRRNGRDITYLRIDAERRYRLYDYLESARSDIARRFPLFREEWVEQAFAGDGFVYLCLRGFEIQGCAVFLPSLGRYEALGPVENRAFAYLLSEAFPEKILYTPLDYVAPPYRDFGLDRNLFAALATDTGHAYRYAAAVCEKRNGKEVRYWKSRGYRPVREFDLWVIMVRKIGD